MRKLLLTSTIFFSILFMANSVWAVEITNPLKYNNFQDIVNAIIDFIYWVGVAGVAPVMLIIAGFMFVTSGGSPERVGTAKKMILYTLIGVVVLLFAKGLILVLKSILGVTTT